MLNRLLNPLGSLNQDFTFFATENYDVFYSGANGTPHINGSFLTIEGIWQADPRFGGMNITGVELAFSVGPNRRPIT